MAESRFVYVTYIRTTRERLWDALTNPEFIRQYWAGQDQTSEWSPGASWEMTDKGRLLASGEIVESDPPSRLVIRWVGEFRPDVKEEGASTATYTIETVNEAVKLTVLHVHPKEGAQIIHAVSGGWPKILSALKTILETGEPLDTIFVPMGKA